VKCLPCDIEVRITGDDLTYETTIWVADDFQTWSTKTFKTTRAQDGIYLALAHLIATTRRVVASFEAPDDKS